VLSCETFLQLAVNEYRLVSYELMMCSQVIGRFLAVSKRCSIELQLANVTVTSDFSRVVFEFSCWYWCKFWVLFVVLSYCFQAVISLQRYELTAVDIAL